ncbi:hypothetical protein [Spirosoma aerophilum]
MDDQIDDNLNEMDLARLRVVEAIKYSNNGVFIDFVLPGYAATQLIGYQSMLSDLNLCLDAAKKLIDDENTNYDATIKTCLWHTIIALYGKCFTDATTSKSPKLEVKDCQFNTDLMLLETHNHLIELRHNFVAHRGETAQDVGIAYLRLHSVSLEKGVWVNQIKRNYPEEKNVASYIRLIEHLIYVVEAKFEKAAHKAWDHMLSQYTPKQMAFLKIAGPKNL